MVSVGYVSMPRLSIGVNMGSMTPGFKFWTAFSWVHAPAYVSEAIASTAMMPAKAAASVMAATFDIQAGGSAFWRAS